MDRRSLLPSRLLPLAPLVAIDLGARLLVPGAMLAAIHGEPRAATAAAIGVSALAVVRSFLHGWSVEREVISSWAHLLEATILRNVTSLRARPAKQSVAMLLDAVQQVALLRAVTLPRLLADVTGLGLVAAVVTWRLGVAWTVAGFVLATVLGAALGVGRRRLLRVEQHGYDALAELGFDLMTLIEGASELRAHAREHWLLGDMTAGVARVAASQRRANRYSALLGLLPIGVALLAALVSQHLLPDGLPAGEALAEMTVLGGAALVLGMGAVRALEAIARSQPQRDALAAFVAGPADAIVTVGNAVPSWDEPIVLERVAHRHAGSTAWTPEHFDLRWLPRESLVLTGGNGAGKSTLAMILLGLVTPTEGTVRIGDVPLAAVDMEVFRGSVTYLPQSPLVVEGRSLEWHLRLTAGESVPRDELRVALDEVGLSGALASRIVAANDDPLDLELGTLSGGERQRLLLARLVVSRPAGRPKLIVVDEPEVGLDADGRRLLRHLLERLSSRARVLLIAHDGSIAPSTFREVRCEAGRGIASSARPGAA
ncbi:MAG: ATP-binding cassette domain-containing protein [Polyangiaceae bacterium]